MSRIKFLTFSIPALLSIVTLGGCQSVSDTNLEAPPAASGIFPSETKKETLLVRKLEPAGAGTYSVASTHRVSDVENLANIKAAITRASGKETLGRCFIPRHQVVFSGKPKQTWTLCFECNVMVLEGTDTRSAVPYEIQSLLETIILSTSTA